MMSIIEENQRVVDELLSEVDFSKNKITEAINEARKYVDCSVSSTETKMRVINAVKCIIARDVLISIGVSCEDLSEDGSDGEAGTAEIVSLMNNVYRQNIEDETTVNDVGGDCIEDNGLKM